MRSSSVLALNARIAATLGWLLAGLVSGCRPGGSASGPSAGEDSIRSARLYRYAEEQAEQGRFEEALSALQDAIRANPRLPQNYLLRGRLLADSSRSQEALRDFREAHRLRPGEVEVIMMQLRAMPHYGLHSEMELLARKALALNPQLAEAHYFLALALAHAPGTRPEEQERALRRAAELAPEMELPYLELGKLHFARQELGQARTVLERAWQLLGGDQAIQTRTGRESRRKAAFWLFQVYQRSGDLRRGRKMAQSLQRIEQLLREEMGWRTRAHSLPPDLDAHRKLAALALEDGEAYVAARYAQVVLRQEKNDEMAMSILEQAARMIRQGP